MGGMATEPSSLSKPKGGDTAPSGQAGAATRPSDTGSPRSFIMSSLPGDDAIGPGAAFAAGSASPSLRGNRKRVRKLSEPSPYSYAKTMEDRSHGQSLLELGRADGLGNGGKADQPSTASGNDTSRQMLEIIRRRQEEAKARAKTVPPTTLLKQPGMPELRTPDGNAPRNLLESAQALAAQRKAREAANPAAQSTGLQPAVFRPGQQQQPSRLGQGNQGRMVRAQVAGDSSTAAAQNTMTPDIKGPGKAPVDLKQAPPRRGHTDSDLLAAETTPPRDTRGDFDRIGSLEIEPADEIWINSDYYGYMHEELQKAPEAIRSKWFQAAHRVTRPQTAGAVEHGARWLIDEQDQDYVRHLHYELAKGNFERFKLLRQGKDIPGLEGLRGRELDYALVKLEQQEADRITNAYWKGRPPEQRAVTMERLSEDATAWYSQARPYIRKVFPEGGYDNNNLEHRIAIGKTMVDSIYQENN